MNIMVVGGAGFCGTNLIQILLEKGYKVICYDAFLFGKHTIQDFKEQLSIIDSDIRGNVLSTYFQGVDVVVNLAAISQPDELKRIDPKFFYEINYLGALNIAKKAKKNGVKRHIFASTCSVYGAQDGQMTEATIPKPLEAYGKYKFHAEQEILDMSDHGFCVTSMRPATMYGTSQKMRFDLVVNAMTWTLYKYGKINVMRPGTQYRPNIHVLDVCEAIIKIIEAEEYLVDQEIYNIGDTNQNYQIKELGELIGRSVSNDYAIEMFGAGDRRSYNVSFEKLKKNLKFEPKYSVSNAAKDIYNALESSKIAKTTKSLNLSWYEKIISEGKLKLYGL